MDMSFSLQLGGAAIIKATICHDKAPINLDFSGNSSTLLVFRT